ncbi:hypothetical protein [Salipaludibacillus aurantiacus]|uniref:Minor tail protein n=1 Tax=Salipaludibacillus aurantiacus TaxID=1601833 RepID=A0A1H9TZY9_9BACI|nr:hypothetical protein [Salipaludibacillus aurantiacus]SES02568.1 hypothetical protein SAMN05518684_106193 [Salipaludibacillus aurantiacus]
MAELGRFIDGEEYGSQQFAEFFQNFLSTGFFDGLEVEADDSMTITIKEGAAFIEGYEYRNTDDLELTHNTANTNNDRIDRVVIRLDQTPDASQPLRAMIRTGSASSNPEPPDLIRENGIYEISLAQVLVSSGSSVIPQSDITDERGDTDVCGRVGMAGRLTQQVDSVDVRTPSTPAGQFREGETNFYVHGVDHADTLDEWFDSLPVSPSTYDRDLDQLRMYVQTVSRRNNTGLQTVTIFDWSLSRDYQVYGQFVRASNSIELGTWGRWQEVVMEFERGENANGHFIKYTNGDMVCRFEDDDLTAVENTTGGPNLHWARKTFAYPEPFVNRPTVTPITRREATIQWAGTREITETDVEIYLISVNENAEGYLSYEANGRWR